jgi:hypothetical protein
MPFAKGKSGNPGGRIKIPDEFKNRAKSIVDKHVIKYWEKEVVNEGPNAMKASELLVAYAYGKPSQAVELSGKEGGPIEVSWLSGEQ